MPDAIGYVVAAYVLAWSALGLYGAALLVRARAAARRVDGEGALP